MSRGLTRRGLLGGGAAAVAVLAVGATPVAAASIDTFALDATGGTECGPGCNSCSACRTHAANKLFRTNAAADSGRAHPGCNCTVTTGQPLSQGVLDAMFQTSDMADRRYEATAALLTADLESHSVPLITGLLPAAVLAGGAAGILWVAHRRNHIDDITCDLTPR
jgi:hypothetical protein